MIKSSELNTILERAYVPEQMTDYVTAVSGAEPSCLKIYCLPARTAPHLHRLSLGRRLQRKRIMRAWRMRSGGSNPTRIALTAPCYRRRSVPKHSLFRSILPLDLTSLAFLRSTKHDQPGRATAQGGEAKNVDRGHQDLVREFLRVHPVAQETQFIFERFLTISLPRGRHGF